MGRTDRNYLLCHPFRWATHFWPHWLLGIALIAIAIAVSHSIFNPILGAGVWPFIIGFMALLILSGPFFPFSKAWQGGTVVVILSVSVFRSLAYLQLLLTDAISPRAHPLLAVLVAHWMVLAILGAVWPKVTEVAALRATNAAGARRGNGVA